MCARYHRVLSYCLFGVNPSCMFVLKIEGSKPPMIDLKSGLRHKNDLYSERPKMVRFYQGLCLLSMSFLKSSARKIDEGQRRRNKYYLNFFNFCETTIIRPRITSISLVHFYTVGNIGIIVKLSQDINFYLLVSG